MNKFLEDLKRHLLTGVSYMIPFVIAGAVLMAFARIGSTPYGIKDIWDAKYAQDPSAIIRFFHDLDGFGGIALGLMLPIIGGYISFSIADKPGLAPGLVAGLLAKNLNTGFLGALAAGLIAGYICKWLKKIKLPEYAMSIVPIFIIPVFGTLFTMLIMNYALGIPLQQINVALIDWLKSMSGGNKILVAAIIGAMVGFDLGGPVNKAAVTTSMLLITSGVFEPNTAAQVAIIIPPLGLGLATVFSKRKFNYSLRQAGNAALVMGLVGISEGAIPFALNDPIRVIPINVIGCALGSALAVGLGAVNETPISGIYGWFTVYHWYYYVLSIAVGTLTIAILVTLFGRSSVEEEDLEEA